MKTFIAKFEKAVLDKLPKEEIMKAFSTLQSELMRGASKKVIKKGTAARKISRMYRKMQAAFA